MLAQLTSLLALHNPKLSTNATATLHASRTAISDAVADYSAAFRAASRSISACTAALDWPENSS